MMDGGCHNLGGVFLLLGEFNVGIIGGVGHVLRVFKSV